MQVVRLWAGHSDVPPDGHRTPPLAAMAETMAACNNARLDADSGTSGDPTEIALLAAAAGLGQALEPARREAIRARRPAAGPARPQARPAGRVIGPVPSGQAAL